DEIFARIAESFRNCQFVFVRHNGAQQITQVFEGRLERVFSKYNLKSDAHCIFLPVLSYDRFIAAMGLCDIFLDSVGWSGCNSTLESLFSNLPIVTLDGNLMRGRHTSAILRMMGITETITTDIDDYIKCAVRLAASTTERAKLSQSIEVNKHRVYR